MITGAHVLLYAKDADKARAFFRDTLGFSHVNAGEGWLIFELPPAEMGIHPLMGDGADAGAEFHELHMMCEDIEATVADLRAKGVEITQPIEDRGWGIVTAIRVPGAGVLSLYQPRHPIAHAGRRSARAAKAPKARAPKKAKQPSARRKSARKVAKRVRAKR